MLRNAGGDKLRCEHVGPAGSVERVYIGEQLSATYYGVKYTSEMMMMMMIDWLIDY